MLIRLRNGRRFQTSLKLVACVLVAVFYVTFLFRESLNAFEQNKDKAEAAAAALAGVATGAAAKSDIKPEPKLLRSLRLQYQKQLRQQQQQQRQRQLQQSAMTTPAESNGPTAASTLNPVYEYSEEIHSATERDLQQRRLHLGQVCQRYHLHSLYPPKPWEFFISPGHSLVWCNVFKAASSTWMYYFNILGGYDIKFLQRTETQPLELARKRFPRPEINELLDSMPSSLTFLFVRDPFERIVSAYRNKLESGHNAFYKALATRIVRRYRKHATAGRAKPGPTFDEFVHFLIDEYALDRPFDEHWAPVYSFCTPCTLNFTIIGKVETFARDSEFIIRQAGLESLLLGKLPKNKLGKIGNLAKGLKTDTLVERYFAEINRNTLDQLLEIYRLDFELFDYNYTKYYDLVEPAPLATTTLPASQLTTLVVAAAATEASATKVSAI